MTARSSPQSSGLPLLWPKLPIAGTPSAGLYSSFHNYPDLTSHLSRCQIHLGVCTLHSADHGSDQHTSGDHSFRVLRVWNWVSTDLLHPVKFLIRQKGFHWTVYKYVTPLNNPVRQSRVVDLDRRTEYRGSIQPNNMYIFLPMIEPKRMPPRD